MKSATADPIETVPHNKYLQVLIPMSEREPAHGYNYSLNVVEIVCRMINFDQSSNEIPFEEVLDSWVEAAEYAYDDAQQAEVSVEKLEALKADKARRQAIRGQAKALFTELHTAAAEIWQGCGHPHLVLSSQPYAAGYPEFSITSVYNWAKECHGSVIPAWAPPPRQPILVEQPPPQPIYSTGQYLFLAVACLLDQLLTIKEDEWRLRLQDNTVESSGVYIVNGKFKLNVLAQAVVRQFPGGRKGRNREKAVEGHIKAAKAFLTEGQCAVETISKRKQRWFYRTLYGLARVTWIALTGQNTPIPPNCDYPPDTINVLTVNIPETSPITGEELTRQLHAARLAVIRMKETSE